MVHSEGAVDEVSRESRERKGEGEFTSSLLLSLWFFSASRYVALFLVKKLTAKHSNAFGAMSNGLEDEEVEEKNLTAFYRPQ